MTATIIAASAGDLVVQVGAYAGYAAIIGLGILALLYFTQAREVKRLREWAGRAPERAAELEERVQADAQKRVVAQPIAPASAAGAQSAEARTQAATAAVYASIGAVAPGAAPPPGQLARPVPSAPAPGSAPAPSAPSPGTLPVASGPTASAGTQTPPIPTPAPGVSPLGRPIVTATASPPAETPAAAAAARAAAASRTIGAPSNGSTNQDTAESAAARPEPLPEPPPPPSPFAHVDEDDDKGSFGLSTARVGMIVGGAVAAVVVAVVLMVALTGNDNTPTPQNNIGDAPVAQPSGSADSPKSGSGSGSSSSSALTSAERRATDIAVLNGTTQTGLARAVANKIQEDGFSIVGVDTNADQSVPTTVVSYTADNEPAALAVAKVMGIDKGSVQAADANAAAAASADVIVIVGSDQIE